MGRLFHYNRFGKDNDDARKDNSKSKEIRHIKSNLSRFAELYPNEKTLKNFEQLWSDKLLCANVLSAQSVRCQAYSCLSSSIQKGVDKSKDELVAGNLKRTSLYNCMKEFLKRKVFQQQTEAVAKSYEKNDDETSDYDELDVLDSSYNADEEDYDEDTADGCECSTDPCSCDFKFIKSTSMNSHRSKKANKSKYQTKCSPLKSALSFSCWQQNSPTDTMTTNSVNTTDNEDNNCGKNTFSRTLNEISDDAGISDCCQLIVKTQRQKLRTPHCRRPKKSHVRKQQRQHVHLLCSNDDEDEDSDEFSELLSLSWYQPRITTKAAHERLQQSLPGSFLVRRKARTFELCLRTETKVKQFTVITTTNETFKLKGAKKQFSSLKALVTHHSVMAEQLPLTLSLPREQKILAQVHMRQRSNDFETLESLQIREILQKLQTKNFDIS